MLQNGFTAEVIRTEKIDVNDDSHPLPPHNGRYEEFQVADWFCPDEWSKDGVFIAVKEGDPLWFDFRGNDECAVLCAIQRLNPVTGEPANLDEGLTKDPTQNYLSMPRQRWLDGYANKGKVYQFIVTKAGIGLAVNEFLLPAHMQDSHAIGFAFFAPKNPKPKPQPERHRGLYASISPHQAEWVVGSVSPIRGDNYNCSSRGSKSMSFNDSDREVDEMHCMGAVDSIKSWVVTNGGDVYAAESIDIDSCLSETETAEIFVTNEIPDVEVVDVLAEREADLTQLDKASMGQGGRIVQSIITDNNTVDYYHEKRSGLLTIYFALPEMFQAIQAKGRRQDASKPDRFKKSGTIGGVAVPLID